MKLKYYRSNSPLFRDVTATLTADNTVTVVGHICWFKTKTACGVAYRKKGNTTFNYSASDSQDVNKTIASLENNKNYEFCLYLKRGTLYNYSSIVECKSTYVDPTFDTPVASSVSSSGFTVGGTITYGGTPTAMGVCYRKKATEPGEWSTKTSASKTVSEAISSLDADTTYEFGIYATIGTTTFYSAIVEQKTDEAEQNTEA